MSTEPTIYRSVRWLNLKKKSIFYGIQGNIDGEWFNIKEGDTPLFFDTQAEAIKKVKEFNKEIRTTHE